MGTDNALKMNTKPTDEYETRRIDNLGRVVLPVDWRRWAGMEINTYINIHFISYTIVLVSAGVESENKSFEMRKQEKIAWLSAAAAFPSDYQSFIRAIVGICSKESEVEHNQRTYFFSRKMDKLGRVVIPKEFREPLALVQGTNMNIYTNGKIVVLIPQKFDRVPGALRNMLFAASAFPPKYQPLLLNVAAMAADIDTPSKDVPAVPKPSREQSRHEASGKSAAQRPE